MLLLSALFVLRLRSRRWIDFMEYSMFQIQVKAPLLDGKYFSGGNNKIKKVIKSYSDKVIEMQLIDGVFEPASRKVDYFA